MIKEEGGLKSCMTKYLSAKQKALELGITTSGLAKTRHLYKHIRKSPHKYLYFPEEASEVFRPTSDPSPVTPGSSSSPRSPRSQRRRNVPFGKENYHKCPAGSGNSLQRLNQLRSKIAYEGKIPKDQIEHVDEALADFHVHKSKEIIEAKRIKRGQEVDRETERIREAHYKNRLSGIYNCADSGRKYPYTISQYYDQKEKLYGPSNDVLLADRIRRGKKIDTSFHLTGKPYRGDYEDEETPWWQKD